MLLKKIGVGIFGGSFDPPHKAHLKISKISLKKIGLKKFIGLLLKKIPLKENRFIRFQRE